MYALYTKQENPDGASFQFLKESHIFGCNVGLIPKLLVEKAAGHSAPCKWHLPVSEILADENQTFIIDLKPNNKNPDRSLSLYELRDVWGFSDPGWTPAMIRLRGLVVDGNPTVEDSTSFQVSFKPENKSIYSFLYFDGTLMDGQLHGAWTPPSRSPTNSVLLWPRVLRHFVEVVNDTTPQVLGELTHALSDVT